VDTRQALLGQNAPDRTGFVWFEVQADVGGKILRVPYEFGNAFEYPAPAWYLTVPHWRSLAGAQGRPVLRAWVSRNKPDIASWTLKTGELGKGAPVDFGTTDGRRIKQLTAHLEERGVDLEYNVLLGASKGTVKRYCLVVNFEVPDNNPVLVQLAGTTSVAKQQHLSYSKETGRYTSTFALDHKPDANEKFELKFVSLKELQNLAEQQGNYFEITLDSPGSDDLPPPSNFRGD
jgi:hypothetical protein